MSAALLLDPKNELNLTSPVLNKLHRRPGARDARSALQYFIFAACS